MPPTQPATPGPSAAKPKQSAGRLRPSPPILLPSARRALLGAPVLTERLAACPMHAQVVIGTHGKLKSWAQQRILSLDTIQILVRKRLRALCARPHTHMHAHTHTHAARPMDTRTRTCTRSTRTDMRSMRTRQQTHACERVCKHTHAYSTFHVAACAVLFAATLRVAFMCEERSTRCTRPSCLVAQGRGLYGTLCLHTSLLFFHCLSSGHVAGACSLQGAVSVCAQA